MKQLNSSKNPELKRLRLLFQKARERKKQGVFVIEGEREIKKVIKGSYSLECLFIEAGQEVYFSDFLSTQNKTQIFTVEKTVFSQISIRSGSEKIIAIAQNKTHNLEQLKLPENALVLVIEAPEKPGNIGALYRTAAAANMDAVIIANPKTDFYNPNSIRSSLGALFLLPTAIASSQEVIEYLKEQSFSINTAAIEANAVAYDAFDYKPPCAIVMGTESTGLDRQWIEASNQNILIPMSENVDSLNLSVSAGILMYEAQRKNKRLDMKTIL